MKNTKIKPGAIARVAALAVALIKQCLVMFGQDALPFTGELTYQVVSIVLTVIVVCINSWYNNDFTPLARTAGKLFDALKDGQITPEEVESFLDKTDKTA